MADDYEYPFVPFNAVCRRFTPRSGYEFLKTITGRSMAEMRWWDMRTRDMLSRSSWNRKSISKILLQERSEQGWKPEGGSQ